MGIGMPDDATWRYVDTLQNKIANLELERDWLRAELTACQDPPPTPDPGIHPID